MMTTTTTRNPSPLRRTRGPSLFTIELQRARCPRCQSSNLRKYRSLRDRGDGSAIAWVECRRAACGFRFRVVQK